MNIVNESVIKIRGNTYKQIQYDTGEVILKRFNDKAKMWVELKFNKVDDAEVINALKISTTRILTKATLN